MQSAKEKCSYEQVDEADHDSENQIMLLETKTKNFTNENLKKEEQEKNIICVTYTKNPKEEKESEMSIDDLLNKIGFNTYHIVVFFIVVLSLISDGVEIYLIYLIAPVLSYANGYSENFISIMTSILFLGMALGCIASGLITKYLGRKNGILLFLTLITIFGTFCVSINNIVWFMLCRFIVGVSVGFLFNIVNAFCEILPLKYRDFIIGSIFFAIKLGIIYFTFIYYFFSIYFDIVNSYKTIVILSSLPMIICWIVAVFYFDESPRILLWNCDYDKAFEIIMKMNKGSTYDFNEEEKNKIIFYIESALEKEYCHLKKITEKENENKDNFSIKNNNNNIIVDAREEKNKNELKDKSEKTFDNNIYDFKRKTIYENKFENISLEEKKKFILENKKSWKNFGEIFRNKKLTLTILVCLLWALNSLCLVTNSFSLPIILANENKQKQKEIFENYLINSNSTKMNLIHNTTLIVNSEKSVDKVFPKEKSPLNSHALLFNGTEKIRKILISNLVPLPAEFLAGYLTIHDKFGKKNVIFLGFFFMSICSFFMIIFPDWLYLFSSGINFFSVFSFNITKLYTSLVYHTDNRDFAYGLANFTSKIVAIAVPFFSNFMMNINLYATCYVILLSSVGGCLITAMLNENLSRKPIK